MSRLGKASEKGDAGVVLLVILVVALLGALGWMFWKNMDTKSEAVDQQTQQTADVENKEAVVAVREWGIEIPVGDSLKTVTVKSVPNEDRTTYEVLVGESTLFNDESKSGTQALGMLERYKAGDKANGMYGAGETFEQAAKAPENKDKMVLVGEYVYVYIARQQGAYGGSDEKSDSEKGADDKLETLSTVDFPAAFKQLRKEA